MAMLSFSATATTMRSICRQPRISAKLLNHPKTLRYLQGNLLSWSSSASYLKLQPRKTLVYDFQQKRVATFKCATIEEIEAENSLIEKNVKEKMKKTINNVLSNFSSIRTGRSNPAMLDKLEVEYYGSLVNLKTIAQISTPDSSSLLVQPYDKSSLKAIEKAVINYDLGMTPNNDGEVIRLSLPQLTSERRKELSKIVAKQAEEGKPYYVVLEKKLSEDNVKDLSGDLQRMMDKYMKKIDSIYKQKEKELLTV